MVNRPSKEQRYETVTKYAKDHGLDLNESWKVWTLDGPEPVLCFRDPDTARRWSVKHENLQTLLVTGPGGRYRAVRQRAVRIGQVG